MLFSYGSGQQRMDNNNKMQASCHDCHADAAVQHGVHWPMEHIQGIT